MQKVIRSYIYVAGALLVITGIAKLVSAMGSARILENPDPILPLSFRKEFWMVGLFELGVAMVCFFGRKIALQSGLVAWLATNFAFYRLGLVMDDWHRPCPCLGNLTDAIHLAPEIADTAMKIVLAYLLLGSYATLFWLWRQHRKAGLTRENNQAKTAGGSQRDVGR